MSDSDLVLSALAMAIKRKTCINCWHGRERPDTPCLLYSCNCATDVGNHQSYPSRWTGYSEGETNELAARQDGYHW